MAFLTFLIEPAYPRNSKCNFADVTPSGFAPSLADCDCEDFVILVMVSREHRLELVEMAGLLSSRERLAF